MPNDAPEIQRLNDQHLLLTLAKDGALHHAPIKPSPERPLKVLDVGCGSGIWCLQIAEKYRDGVMVVGMDVSAGIQPKNKPANVEWIEADMEQPWPFPEQYFDFIHLSLVHGCVADWQNMYAERISGHLAPGGWVEHQEFSLCRQYLVDENNQRIAFPEKAEDLPPLLRWGRLMEQAADKRGRTLQLGPKLTTFQSSASLQDTQEKMFQIPSGTWPADKTRREVGARMMLSALQGMEGFTTVLFTKALGWTLDGTQAFVQEVKRDLRDDTMRKTLDLHVVWSQKPVSTEEGEAKVKGLVHESGRWEARPEEAWRSLTGSWSVQFAGGMILGGALVGVGMAWAMKRR